MIQRGFRYKLSPAAEQAEKLAQFAGVTRLVYNLALEQRRDYWRQFMRSTGGRLNFVSQGRQVTELRAEFEWIAAVPSSALTQALRDLDRAFAAYGRGKGFPTPRRKGANDSFRCQAKDIRVKTINAKWSAVRVPNIGWVKLRLSRPMRGRSLNITFSKRPEGWFATFACEIEHETPTNNLASVGIDRGVKNTLALSTGEMLSTPCTLALEQRKKRAQRVLARRQRGSQRYRKQRSRVARIAAKIARVRADWRHKTTTDIAKRFGLVAIEALRTADMTRSGRASAKRGLNRSILEQGWGRIETTLAYKLEERGGTLIKINPAYTSQECSQCGAIDKQSRESQARFACRNCGFTGHADTNAAINILRRGTACLPVEVSDCRAVEAGTVSHAAITA